MWRVKITSKKMETIQVKKARSLSVVSSSQAQAEPNSQKTTSGKLTSYRQVAATSDVPAFLQTS